MQRNPLTIIIGLLILSFGINSLLELFGISSNFRLASQSLNFIISIAFLISGFRGYKRRSTYFQLFKIIFGAFGVSYVLINYYKPELISNNSTLFSLILPTIVVTLGLYIILPKKSRVNYYQNYDDSQNVSNKSSSSNNNFTSKVIEIKQEDGTNLKYANTFGNFKIDFTKNDIDHKVVVLHLQNNFGTTKIIIPEDWQVDLNHSDSSFAIVQNNHTNRVLNGIILKLILENSFGNVQIQNKD